MGRLSQSPCKSGLRKHLVQPTEENEYKYKPKGRKRQAFTHIVNVPASAFEGPESPTYGFQEESLSPNSGWEKCQPAWMTI